MGTLTFWVGLPPKALSPNARVHWGAKARATKQYRGDCRLSALAAMPQDRSEFPWPGARVTIDIVFPVKRRRDRDNILASAKAALDGIQDAGIVTNDCTLCAQVGTIDVAGPGERVGMRVRMVRTK